MIDRRTILRGAAALPLTAATASTVSALGTGIERSQMQRIAVEEAFCTAEIAREFQKLIQSGWDSPDAAMVREVYTSDTPNELLSRLLDLGSARIEDMDLNGVDMQVIGLAAPGVQVFDADLATGLATDANDQLAEAAARFPARMAGLACLAPQSPALAAREMERSMTRLGLKGFIINSHTNGEYLDEPKFWPILEAAEALDGTIYLHPRTGPEGSTASISEYGMLGGGWGYPIEAATHGLRLILSGVLDRFPKLRICLGHMGEGLHFFLPRLDRTVTKRSGSPGAPKLELLPSQYFKRNFVVTTSAFDSELVLDFTIKSVGVENVLWAADYPFISTDFSVAFMDRVQVPDSVRHQIYHLNARRVFKL